MSQGKPVCRWPGQHLWIAGGTAWGADPLAVLHGRKVNMGKTNVLKSRPGLDELLKFGKSPCAISLSDVNTTPSSVKVVPEGCTPGAVASGILEPNSTLSCKQHSWQARLVDGRPMTEVTVGTDKLEVVPSFCYLGTPYPQVVVASITRCRVAWGKFIEPLTILTSCSFPITCKDRVYNSCVRCAVLHANESWVPTSFWPGCDLLEMRCHHQGPSQLARSPRHDAAWRSGGASYSTQMTWPCRTWSLVPEEGPEIQWRRKQMVFGWPKKIWPEEIWQDCFMLGLTQSNSSDGNLETGTLRSAIKLDPPLQ